MLDVRILVGCYKFVFVFGMSNDFDRHFAIVIAVEIHRHCDGRETIEEVEQLLGLLVELLLSFIIEVPVPGRDCHLHR
jgi:hypothetical protein